MRKRTWTAGIAVLMLLLMCCTQALALEESEVESAIAASSNEAVAGNIFIWFLCAVAFLKISQKIDGFLAALGINVGRTGGSMLGELLIAGRAVGSAVGGLGGAVGNIFNRNHASGSSTTHQAAGQAFSGSGGGLLAVAKRAAGNAAASSATGTAGGVGSVIGGAMFGSSMASGGKFANSVIGAVATGDISSVGSIKGEKAAQALTSYLGYSGAPLGAGDPVSTAAGAVVGNEVVSAMDGEDQDTVTLTGGAAAGAQVPQEGNGGCVPGKPPILGDPDVDVGSPYAPYLDYRAPSEEERQLIAGFLPSQRWLTGDVESKAMNYAIGNIIPQHFLAVKERRVKAADKTMKAVKERLTAAIQYWDYRSSELKKKEDAGKSNSRLNSQNAARRAEELEARLHKRLDELEKEKQVSAMPPIVMGGALVIPRGLINRLMGQQPAQLFSQGDRKSIEMAAMRAVEEIERKLGYSPRDVSLEKCGYDIESKIPETLADGKSTLRFIEVKGRTVGATTVTVTANEILTALNKPDEYILAVVEVDGSKTKTVYLQHPFHEKPEWTACSVNYDIQDLRRNSVILLEEVLCHA